MRDSGLVEIVVFGEQDTPAELRAQVVALQEAAWPTGRRSGAAEPTHDPALRPLSMLLVEAGEVFAALDILSKDLEHAGCRFTAGGLSTVVTRQDVRGRGLGGRLVAAARDVMAGSGLDLGLFTCDRPLRGFYERAGWRLLPGAVLVGGTPADPLPSDDPAFDKVVLADFFSAVAQAARESFSDCHIELYPGDIDKLW